MQVAQKKYTLARLAAKVLQGLHKYYPSLTVRVVDDLLEDLIFACEAIGPPSDLQRRLGCARLFSELYNCSLVSGTVVFATLHRILDIGHAIPPSLFSISLPPPPPPLEDGGGGNATPLSDEPPVFPLAPWATYDPRAVHPCDPPGDCFRIRIAVQVRRTHSFCLRSSMHHMFKTIHDYIMTHAVNGTRSSMPALRDFLE